LTLTSGGGGTAAIAANTGATSSYILTLPTAVVAGAFRTDGSGNVSFTTGVNTSSNCNSSASPAVCAAASAGSVAIANPATTLTVNTTAVTANSQIFVFEDSGLGTRLGVTCDATTGRTYTVTARSAATSFAIKVSATPGVMPVLAIWL
jgi:hypothetical protein